ncbi:hypothetical protein [Fibrobacter sp. UWP2]|uniref:hypothetical protein n=1 Tax=Fibrobacter sp. UWP2 TaxID=1896216 RepID=UPI000912C497|nr:hypothetical protein [Fibrobacter sp. UWP2]SHJ39976.1 hypothetical protein SAMN05720471_13522 [Fibrobacter sp. UWP2]
MLRTNGEDHVNHMFSDGVPEQGKFATVINAEWLNAVQEEIAQFIEQAGITLDGSHPHQLYDALLAIFMAGIEVGGSGINISGIDGTTNITNGGIRFQGSHLDVELTATGLCINGVNVKEVTVQGVLTLNIDETLELVKNLIVNGSTTFRNNVTVAEGKKLIGDTEGFHNGNVSGNLTGNTNGIHYGNVRADNIYSLTNGGSIGINAPVVFSKKAHFQDGIASEYVSINVAHGYSSILVDDPLYTSMTDGMHVYCLNVSGSVSGVAVSSDKYFIMRAGTGVELVKRGSVWYPLSPESALSVR